MIQVNNLLLVIKNIIFKTSCPACGKKTNNFMEILCENCYNNLKRSSSIKKVEEFYYIWKYEGVFKKIIGTYKFKNIKKIADVFAEIVKEKIDFIIKKEEIDLVIPVPIHKKRKNKRGFNQVEEILKKIGNEYFNIERAKNTKAMFSILSEKGREENIKNCFDIEKNLSLDSLNILIVDDIITTGATLKEMEKEIKKTSTPNKIIFFTFAAAKYNLNKNMNNKRGE